MTHFPQPHPTRRAPRVQLGGSVAAAIQLDDGARAKAKLQAISSTGVLLHLARALEQGDFVEVAFQTKSGPVHGMAEMLSPTRKLVEGYLQPFRFIALGDDDHRKLLAEQDEIWKQRKKGKSCVSGLAGVLTALNETLATCTGCHSTFKQQVVDETTWASLVGQPVPQHH